MRAKIMELRAEVAAAKEKRAAKTAVIAAAQRAFCLLPHLLKILASQFDKHADRMPHGIVELADLISCCLCGHSLYDVDEQLHLAEFAALETKRINDAMDMEILVRKKSFRKENQVGFLNDVDSEDEGDKARNPILSEFLGGRAKMIAMR